MILEAGPSAAVRLSCWNGYDVSTAEGGQRAREERRRLRPKDLWMVTPCGAWSRMQRINQRTPQQIRKLEEKRAMSYTIITYAVACAYDQAEEGGFLHWEWPRDASCHEL